MQHRRIIKQGPIVFATNEDGSMDPSSTSSQGLFLADTRFLSTFQIRLNGVIPVLLGSSEEILFESSFLHTNPDIPDIPARGIGILQRNTIQESDVNVHIVVANWSVRPISVELSVELGSDFFDSFEARGVKRLKRGQIIAPKVTENAVELGYEGLDQVTRCTRIETDPHMNRFEDNRVCFQVDLGINERKSMTLALSLTENSETDASLPPTEEVSRLQKPAWFDDCTRFTVSNQEVDAVMRRGVDDLEVLLTEFPDAWVPAAGLPRFGVPFGRDCLITGLETLIWNHNLSRDVLRFLAARQGKENNPWNYEQPGKIMHELHTGELARLKEVPFGRFYGSVDATPLFLVLGAEYLRWTGDLDLFRELKPHFEAAWTWIADYGEIDKSGYIQYQSHTAPKLSAAALTVGLFNQGWKDNALAVVYSDGTIVTDHPVALAEVQGYYFRALTLWAELYRTMPESEGMRAEAAKLQARADALRERFNREFWMADKGYYAMALDKNHRHVDSITSNPGHCLWTRLIDDERAEQVVRTLMDDSMMTSWGIRTMASNEKAYNPFSYHDGSVWPFDNAIIAAGLKKYGYVEETQDVFDSLIDASVYFEYRRWPEVYCGVSRAVGGVLARQPDASRPQAWSAGAIFLFLQTILGIAPRPFSKHVDITPALPTCLTELVVENLCIAGGRLSLRLVRDGNAILMEIRDNPDELDIVIHPATKNHHAFPGDHLPAVSR
ncbi:MAG: glycogen debranching N-terminal domain-containing protein [Chloroflexota bacterium]